MRCHGDALVGCGLDGGVIVGSRDKIGVQSGTRRMNVLDLAAMIYPNGHSVIALSEGQLIRELV
jgi:hypothetical protein